MAVFIIVSHSKKVAEGVVEIVEQMNNKNSKLIPIGGTEDERIGTNPLKIKKVIEEIYDGDNIFIFADIGSSIMATQMVLDMLNEELRKKITLVDAPLVEGTIAAVIQASITNNVSEIIHAAEESKKVNKFG
ncbi:dihydroxyacetone kinase phosphoryl donor subunit DhaM [Thermoanaerobacter sp. A7A]|uniref:dihydroxyacetone kinase phosphoryl donor subunit DhaM n=1 Tax=Thermoanaerobacter sp. A7A TaxID=1350366 RepID=UPI000411AE17|nr:dihydroxyacetone kinase phosphoryl donor subunit DhaM [Thermoanaerobacter sp. A7A]